MNSAPPPYHSDCFVNRDAEIRLVQRKIERRLEKISPTPPHTAFHGPRGSGKSWLLHRLRDVLPKTFGSRILVLFFSPDPADPDLAGNTLKEALRQLTLPLPRWATMYDLACWLVQQCEERHPAPIVIIVDELDKVPVAPLQDLERYFLIPLSRVENVFLVLGSRVPRPRGRLNDVEFKRRVENVELPPFDEQITREQIERLGENPALAPDILRAGGGYPLTNALLAYGWATDPNQALQQCADALLEGVEEYLRPYFWALCFLDSINEDRMGPVLAAWFNGSPDDWDRQRCRRILSDMVRTRLVQWQKWTSSGFGMDPAVRQVLRSAIQRNEPARWDRLIQVIASLQ